MNIITVAHQKGGVGKTTLAVNLAACFAQGLNVGILETDLQGSLTDTQDQLENITYIPFDGNLARLKELPYDLLVIDTPPYLTSQLSDVFAISDYVLVPTKVGFYDVLAIRSTVELLKQTQQQRPTLRYGVVMNMVKPRTSMNKTIQDLLTTYEIQPLKTTIADRVSYTRSAIMGGIFLGDDEKAKEEMLALADEIMNELGL